MENFEVCENCKKNKCDQCIDEWEAGGEEFVCSCDCKDYDAVDDEDDIYNFRVDAYDRYGYDDDNGNWE